MIDISKKMRYTNDKHKEVRYAGNQFVLRNKGHDVLQRHNPPHFHAEYGGCKALIDIQNACVIRGALPSRQLKLILAWCELHKDELMQNWELARDAKPLNHVEPLI